MNSVLLGTALFLMSAGGAPPPQGDELFAQAEGAWGIPAGMEGSDEIGCDTEPVRIRIDAEAGRYFVQHGSWSDQATILDQGPGWFHLRYDDEARLDGPGDPVSWYWVYNSPDSFYWVRNDWLDTGGRTLTRVRCVASQVG